MLEKADESLAMLKAKRKNLKAYTELINAQILQARLNKWTAGKWATAVISLAWLAVAGVLAFACKGEIFTWDMGSNGGIEKLFFILSAATGTVAGAACFI
ncbi:hypothetical protein [Candidatus Endomicrobiellum agilis]|uniref:hypothetical protein n=1 Tax=Candidatus Endomicrobiellum agilis TaxID=3238957 RepID=UPI00357D36D5|nr:hypothetical protein [Endomicrobium sp.]